MWDRVAPEREELQFTSHFYNVGEHTMEGVYIMPRVYAEDLSGLRFEKLVVISKHGKQGVHAAWNCLCDCGTETVCLGLNLKRGNTKSCGCLKHTHNLKHGHCREEKTTKLYGVWKSVIDRCENMNNKHYSHYGARGIRVHRKWRESFENFLEDMGSTHQEGLSIDRINVNGNYEPSNCRWVTWDKQMQNRRLLKSNTTGVSGVSITKQGKYRAQISVKGIGKQLGNFDTLEEAAEARKEAEQKLWKAP